LLLAQRDAFAARIRPAPQPVPGNGNRVQAGIQIAYLNLISQCLKLGCKTLGAGSDLNIIGAKAVDRMAHRHCLLHIQTPVGPGDDRRGHIADDPAAVIDIPHFCAEAGHALVQTKLPNCDPIHKVSIVARGMTLGYTMALPERDRYLYAQDKFEDDIAGMLGGRAAEEMVFEDRWTGANDDLEKATKLARKMVTAYGMSESLGPLTFGDREEMVFLGREIAEQRNYSEEVAEEIDQEVQRIIEEAHNRARSILSTYRQKLQAIAQRLIEIETIEREEFEAMMA